MQSESGSMKVAVIGGGPSGLYLANAIKHARRKSEITIFEAQGLSAHSKGLGYTLQQLGINLLNKLDPGFQTRLFANSAPQVINKALYKTHNDSRLLPFTTGFSVSRPALLHYLGEMARNAGIKTIQQCINKQDLNALKKDFDLVIGADGIRSVVREQHARQLGARTETLGLHYSWFINETPQCRTEACFYAFRAPEGVVMLTSYPLTPYRQIVIIEMTEACLNSGKFQGNTPEQAIPYLNSILSQNGDRMALKSAGLPWYRFYTNSIDCLHHRNNALVGDAAFAFHFSSGQGVTNAFTMAFTLARCLQRNESVAQALQHYNHACKLAMGKAEQKMTQRAHWLEQIDHHFAATPDQQLLDIFLGRLPEPHFGNPERPTTREQRGQSRL